MMNSGVLALVALFLTTGRGEDPYFELQPSYGDITVVNTSVLISLSMDFKYNNSAVYYICGVSDQGNIDQDNIAHVLSRQFGYHKDGCQFRNKQIDHAVMAISCDNCKGTENHLLRCCNTTLISCGTVLRLKDHCQGSKRQPTIKIASYPGEVLLFPPVSELNPSAPTSFSMGLVAVRKECKDSREWRFINKNTDTVSMAVVNTLCRQIGFTYGNPGFVITLKEAEEVYQYDFNLWKDIRRYSQILSSNIQCSRSQRCLGCCKYNTFPVNKCADKNEMHEMSVVNDSQYLVIRCSFYREKSVPPSGDDKCSVIDTIQDSSVCYPSSHFDDVRLQDSNSGENIPDQGRLEYFKNYQWHTVCDTDFDQNEADIACRMLGFSSAKTYKNYQKDNTVMTSSEVSPLRLSCHGDHARNCSFIISNCNHSQDVEVWCERTHTSSYYLQTYVLPGILGIMVLIFGISTIILCLKCRLKCLRHDRQNEYQNLDHQDQGCLRCFKEDPQNDEDDQQRPNPQNG